jgi:hypothetical protein
MADSVAVDDAGRTRQHSEHSDEVNTSYTIATLANSSRTGVLPVVKLQFIFLSACDKVR